MQQALIVDDSKTARVSLRKLLEKHQISSAMVESAEDALEYLEENHPSMIFMDHMMPGMDGFDAVKVIKADPEKSAIPIVMYTTQQGDIYVGQARALGAADILPKPANSQALTEVLGRVKKIIDDEAAKALAAADAIATKQNKQEPEIVPIPVAAIAPVQQPSPAITQSSPVISQAEPESYQKDRQMPSFFGVSVRQFAMLVIWLAPIVWLLVLYIPAQEQREQLMDERIALYKSIEWLLNQSESYDYGEEPLAGERLERLRELISHLSMSGFEGTIRLEGHTGEFCVNKMILEKGGFVNMLPPANLSVSKCTSIGVSEEDAIELSGQQSEEFKEFLMTSALLESSDIAVEIVRFGASKPKYKYPKVQKNTTVGDWNSIALSNNRVKFVLLPKQ